MCQHFQKIDHQTILYIAFFFLFQQVKLDANAGSVTVAYLPSMSQVSALSSDGELSFEVLNKVSIFGRV